MSRPGITYTDVAEAATHLTAKGTNPTIESIRIYLKTGSSGTIAQHLRTWKTKQDTTAAIATKEKMPEEFVAFMKGLWEKLVTQAEAQVQEIKQETEQTISQQQTQLSQWQREYNQGQQQLQTLKDERDSLLQDKQVLEQWVATHKVDYASLQSKYDGLHQQLREKQARIDELNRLNQQNQENLEHYRETSREQRMLDQQKAEQQQQMLEQAIQQLQQDATVKQHELLQLQQTDRDSQLQLKSLQTELEKIMKQHEAAQSTILQLEKELSRQTQTYQLLQAEQSKSQEQSKALVELEKQNCILIEKLSMAESSIKSLNEQNQLIAREKWELGQEKAQLLGQLKQMGQMLA